MPGIPKAKRPQVLVDIAVTKARHRSISEYRYDLISEVTRLQTTNSNSIINCAMLLSLGYIHEATTYAESCGGDGSPGSGWERDKDEDDDHWWRRCIAVSVAMMRPAKYRVRRGR